MGKINVLKEDNNSNKTLQKGLHTNQSPKIPFIEVAMKLLFSLINYHSPL
jgi:hypothetical protein